MKIKIVFLDAGTMGEDVSLEPLAQLGEMIVYHHTDDDDVFDRIKDAQVVIINKVAMRQPQIDAAKNLKLICVAATGVNHIDIEYANSKGIEVKNVANYSTESVAQVTMAMLLSLSVKLPYYDYRVKNKIYSKSNSASDVSRVFNELSGQTLGIIGLGNIGKRVAKLAQAFGMNVVYYSTAGKPHSSEYKHLDLDELMSVSDYISIHAPLNEKTHNLITYSKLKLCKPSACVINIGRGAIVNDVDIVKALNEGVIAGIGIDVYTTEPLSEKSPYLQIEDMTKAVLLPHIGWASHQARELLVERMADNIKTTFGM